MKKMVEGFREWWRRRQRVDKVVPPILACLILMGLAWQPVSATLAMAAKNAVSTQTVAAEYK